MAIASASHRSRRGAGFALGLVAFALLAVLMVLAVRAASVGRLHADLGWLRQEIMRALPDRPLPDPHRQVAKPSAQPARLSGGSDAGEAP